MKIWNNYGSEHSSNLVMIGSFKDVGSAKLAMEAIEKITDFVCSGDNDYDENTERYPDGLMKLLEEIKFHSVNPSEIGQFRMIVNSNLEENKIVVRTDEIEISGLLKLLLSKGARVEVCSDPD
jgi:hypothetical protein